MLIKTDCKHYQGYVPCKPHKNEGVHCDSCDHYSQIKERIFIIKLGAIGDVIRTTPLLWKIKEEMPNCEITWLTYSPEMVPSDLVDNIFDVSVENLEWLKSNKFDWLINLDKENIAITLTKEVEAVRKSGFTMDTNGKCIPIENEAENQKWLTGLWDDMNQANTKNYMEEIFEICGYDFNNEEYILEDKKAGEVAWSLDRSKKIIGLNTGCGGRWSSRLWPEDYWIELAKNLLDENYEVILLGGKQEDEKNKRIAEASSAKYFGYFDLNTFINLVNQVDLVVTAVTMGMHLAIGLKKKLILFNNIFNKNEFHLYNRGEILEPEMECGCYFTPVCENDCMTTLKVETVLSSVNEWIKK